MSHKELLSIKLAIQNEKIYQRLLNHFYPYTDKIYTIPISELLTLEEHNIPLSEYDSIKEKAPKNLYFQDMYNDKYVFYDNCSNINTIPINRTDISSLKLKYQNLQKELINDERIDQFINLIKNKLTTIMSMNEANIIIKYCNFSHNRILINDDDFLISFYNINKLMELYTSYKEKYCDDMILDNITNDGTVYTFDFSKNDCIYSFDSTK